MSKITKSKFYNFMLNVPNFSIFYEVDAFYVAIWPLSIILLSTELNIKFSIIYIYLNNINKILNIFIIFLIYYRKNQINKNLVLEPIINCLISKFIS